MALLQLFLVSDHAGRHVVEADVLRRYQIIVPLAVGYSLLWL